MPSRRKKHKSIHKKKRKSQKKRTPQKPKQSASTSIKKTKQIKQSLDIIRDRWISFKTGYGDYYSHYSFCTKYVKCNHCKQHFWSGKKQRYNSLVNHQKNKHPNKLIIKQNNNDNAYDNINDNKDVVQIVEPIVKHFSLEDHLVYDILTYNTRSSIKRPTKHLYELGHSVKVTFASDFPSGSFHRRIEWEMYIFDDTLKLIHEYSREYILKCGNYVNCNNIICLNNLKSFDNNYSFDDNVYPQDYKKDTFYFYIVNVQQKYYQGNYIEQDRCSLINGKYYRVLCTKCILTPNILQKCIEDKCKNKDVLYHCKNHEKCSVCDTSFVNSWHVGRQCVECLKIYCYWAGGCTTVSNCGSMAYLPTGSHKNPKYNEKCNNCMIKKERNDVLKLVKYVINGIDSEYNAYSDILETICSYSHGYILMCGNYKQCSNIININSLTQIDNVDAKDNNGDKMCFYFLNKKSKWFDENKNKCSYLSDGRYIRIFCKQCSDQNDNGKSKIINHCFYRIVGDNYDSKCFNKDLMSSDCKMYECLNHKAVNYKCSSCNNVNHDDIILWITDCHKCGKLFCDKCNIQPTKHTCYTGFSGMDDW